MRDLRDMIRGLAGRGLTVLLASHNMDEVEDLCDRVTVLRSGSVVFCGSVPDLRAQAPDPVFGLRTSDDTQAARIAHDVPGVTVERDPGGGLTVHAQQDRLDAYAIALGKADIAVRALDLTARPLEALFFRLTESQPEPVARPVPEAVR
jgi:ABC-2 type transport system ATP-binding protein